MSWGKFFWWVAIAVAVIGSLVMLKMNQEQYQWSGLERDRDSGKGGNDGSGKGRNVEETNYYDLLEVKPSASIAEIRKKYKELALKYHPDRNPDCGERCVEMASKINRAHEVLSDEEKRRVYDATFASFQSIPSHAIELTYENFNEHVVDHRGLFVIQVYAEYYKECKDFSPIWEEVIAKLGHYVKFGRVHATRQVSVVRKLGAAAVVYPVVMSYVNGRFLRLYPTVHTPAELIEHIHEDYPNRQVFQANHEQINSKIVQKHRHYPKSLPMFIIASDKIKPSMLVSSLAIQYKDILLFAHVYTKPMSASHAQQTKKSTGSVRFLSNALTEVYSLPSFKSLPQLIQISPQGNAQLTNKQIDKENLAKYLRMFVANQTIELSTFTYTTQCNQHNIVCFLYFQSCDASTTSRSSRDYLKEFRQLAELSIENWPQIAEKYEPKWLQFAYVNVAKNPEMSVFCRQNESNEVITTIFDGGLQMTTYDTPLSESNDFDSFWTFVNELFEHDYSTPVKDAPNIRPPPSQNPTIIEDFKEYIEDFDWKSEDFILNVIIVGSLIVGAIVLKQVGCAGFVMFVFALSIFGGGLHAFLGMGDGEFKPFQRSRKKGK